MDELGTIITTVRLEKSVVKNVDNIIVRKWKKEGKFPFETLSDVVNSILIRYKDKLIEPKKYLRRGLDKSERTLLLTKEAKDTYNLIKDGDKSYIVNALLRTWLEENE